MGVVTRRLAAALPQGVGIVLKELFRQPELDFLHGQLWLSRTIIVLQYWRSMEQLIAYAKSKQAAHLPAWQAFNRAVGTNGSVGIWHETSAASPGSYENNYVNMPPFGLGKIGTLHVAKRGRQTAAARLRAHQSAP
jgi:hypothetical protein